MILFVMQQINTNLIAQPTWKIWPSTTFNESK